ncbi:hypothetical protein QGN29_01895 [Temperatibacter marinus]|uniref:Uncharacterized protein n=1 Tax=Temperatibacter marinus TaxID=1456591 RepID=A0AA52EIF0_9PROT|nr:hypothetical protein [Temperatibacter marinus]WND03117.1 hypothetical protein QGN29_01895 [Temperatibacter marinus]
MTMNEENVTKNPDQEELDVQEMTKGHVGLKLLVLFMGIAILGMIVLIAMKSMEVLSGSDQDKPIMSEEKGSVSSSVIGTSEKSLPTSYQSFIEISKPEGMSFHQADVSGMRMTVSYKKGNETLIQVIDLETGRLLSSVHIK